MQLLGVGLACWTVGLFLGLLLSRRWRRQHFIIAKCRLQLIALRNENRGFRRKRKRPQLRHHQKWLLALLHWLSPTLTRYTSFSPRTLVAWHRHYVRRYWWLISRPRPTKKTGRPRLAASIRQIIIDIKRDNPEYGSQRIASILAHQLGQTVSQTTVRNVLKHMKGGPPTKGGQRWKTFIDNHRECMASMDFKVTFDWKARPLFILSLMDHHRRQLIHCRATYHPTSAWVAQQMREAFPFNEAPKIMLTDNDRIFLPVIRQTLPAMGVAVMRTAIKCPQQNGIIERFNRTLTDELLNAVIPINEQHLNRLLREFKQFYNTARPHRANSGEAPAPLDACNDERFEQSAWQIESTAWLGGLHHSYRQAV